MIECDLCKNKIGVTHLLTVTIADQVRIFKNIKNIHHVHICSDCMLKLYPSEALNAISEVEEQIINEVLNKSLKGQKT